MKGFFGETLSNAMLDPGCKKNVCGKTWMACYLETLIADNTRNVETKPSSTVFKFGNGEQVK